MKEINYTVTITRQFGSLGRPIARKMAELLEIEYYDRDIVEKAAERLNLPVSVVDDREESAKTAEGSRFFSMMFPLGRETSEVQNKIFEAQQNIIKFVSEKHPCVIVGRCSDYALQNTPNCVHVYIYSSYENRLENCVKDLDLTVEEAKRMIREVDKARESYHLNYAGYRPEDPAYKDIMIDSSLLGVDKTAEYLAQLIKLKFTSD